MNWFVDNGKEVVSFEAKNKDEAITKFFDSEPEYFGLFIQVYTKGTKKENRISDFVPRELLRRHKIKNGDVVKLLNDMGWEAAEDDKWYALLRDNAKFFKELEGKESYG